MKRKRKLTMLVTVVTAITLLLTPQAAMAGTEKEEAKAQFDSAKQQLEYASEAYEQAQNNYNDSLYSSAIEANKNMVAAQKKLADALENTKYGYESGISERQKEIEDNLALLNYIVPTKEEAERMGKESLDERERLRDNYLIDSQKEYGNVCAAIGKEFLDTNSGEKFTVDELAEYYLNNSNSIDESKFRDKLNTYLRIDNMLYSAKRMQEYNNLRKQNGVPEVKVSYDMIITEMMSYSGSNAKSKDGLDRHYKAVQYQDWQFGGPELTLTYSIMMSDYPGIEKMTVPEIIFKYPEFVLNSSGRKVQAKYLDESYAFIGWIVNDSSKYPDSIQNQALCENNIEGVTAGATATTEEYINAIEACIAAHQSEIDRANSEVEQAKEQYLSYHVVETNNYLKRYLSGREDFTSIVNSIKSSNPSAKIKQLISAVEEAEKEADSFAGKTADSPDKAALEEALQKAKAEYDIALENYRKEDRKYSYYRVSIKNATVNIEKEVEYNGKPVEPAISVVVDGKTLNAATDYDVQYSNSNNKFAICYIEIFGKGEYKDSVKASFDIIPKKVKLKKAAKLKKAFKVSWSKCPYDVTGYQIAYSTNKGFTPEKIVTVKGRNKTTRTISKLKKGKKYYVKVRVYYDVNGLKCQSKWSNIKTVKTK